MKQTVRSGALLVGLIAGLAGAARAQAPGGHTHAAPHGGEVAEVAEHHVEFKADPSGAISVWLLDANQKTIVPPRSGKVTLMPAAGEPITLPLQVVSGTRRLGAAFDATKFKSFLAVVSLPIEGKRHNFRFHYPPSHH